MSTVKVTRETQKDTAMAICLLLIGLSLYFKDSSFSIGGAIILFIAMTVPNLLKLPTFLWFSLSELLGVVSSKIILTIVFIFVVTPIALLMRVLGKDHLKMNATGDESAFNDRVKQYEASDLENPF